MNKYVKSENGNTLMIVLGFVIVLSLVIAPLALRTTNGLLQAQSGGLKEGAYADAHSAMTLFASLYEEAKKSTLTAFGGLASEEAWITFLDNDIAGKVRARYPNVHIQRVDIRVDNEIDYEWVFSAKKGPSVVTYDTSGSYYRSGEVVFSLKNGANSGTSNPLPIATPPPTGGGDEPPTIPVGGKVMLKAVSSDGLPKYNKMFAACEINVSGNQVNVLSHDWIGEWKQVWDAGKNRNVWTLDDSAYFDNYFTAEQFDAEYGLVPGLLHKPRK